MNFNNILNDIVATLIATILIAITTIAIKRLTHKYKKDKLEFILDINFYIDFFITIFTCLLNNPLKLFFDFDIFTLFGIACIIVDVFLTISAYIKMKNYTHYSSNNTKN